ncbi:glycoside hydrolase family 2 protein [Polychaeton citri CBS 116435]|uniref:Glycoside hydrolase family 2 protein n=1 Tax=Polychaeton citri CBS 116435 TaxID=1314669 RepID=A0A9P4QAK9_9PEZI|nr:glycoside hydrolase family 2 protein [Polychaeton citri CBS 116435]
MAADSYPRPDWQRTNLRWKSLDGTWGFAFDDEDIGLSKAWQHHGIPSDQLRTIQVPYVFQSKASGVNKQGVHEVLWYERDITDPRTAEQVDGGDRAILRFGAVDYKAIVWVSGIYVGEHRGGHVPFELDVTDAFERLKEASKPSPARLMLRVYDSANDLTQPRGKQYWGAQPEDIFYFPSSGIWQSVWLETVPSTRIADGSGGTVIRCDNIQDGNIFAKVAFHGSRAAAVYTVELEASFGGQVVRSERRHMARGEERLYSNLNVRLNEQQQRALPAAIVKNAPLSDDHCWLRGVALWSPEHPQLYDLTIRLLSRSGNQLLDEVNTQVGMRSIDWTKGDGTFRLNNKPIFQKLVLDQGYWPNTLMTPPEPASQSLKADVELSRALGFNGCRKHQKIEDPRFLYWANKLGYLVWGEIANAYAFNEDYVMRFDQEWTEAVKRDINHPCVVTWTPVNESWGYPDLGGNAHQRHHIRALTYMTNRPVNDNCGWEHVSSDLTTFHDYADTPGMAERSTTLQSVITRGRAVFLPPIGNKDPGSSHAPGAPVICTEFGGVNIAPSANGDRKKDWGYTTASDARDLLKRIEKLVQAVVHGGVCCGLVYTQLTDIEKEVNGLYTYDRKQKFDPARLKKILDDAEATYFKLTSLEK